MILAARHRKDVLSIRQNDEAGLLSHQEFLDNYATTSVAERVAGQHIGHCGLGLLERFCHDHAFARCESVRLDHDRSPLLAQVGQRGL